MKFSIVVSVNNHDVIGEGNDLLIHSKKDLRNFQKITTEGQTHQRSDNGIQYMVKHSRI